MRIEDYEPLDLNVFVECGRIAVKCNTKEQCDHFLAAMKTQYPQKCESWTFPNRWGGAGECFCAGIHQDDKWSRMMHGSEDGFKDNNYTIVDFESLVISDPIEESEKSFDFLFWGA